MSAHTLNIDLFISTQCPHCAHALELLTKAIKQGTISELKIINISTLDNPEQHNYEHYSHIRSVPFIQVGDYEFTGELKKPELDTWIKAHQDGNFTEFYFSKKLMDGNINTLENFIKRKPAYWMELVKLVQDAETKMQVRIGITAIFESSSSDIAKITQCDDVVASLMQASKTENHAIRVDLIYILSLIFTALKNQQRSNSKLNDFMALALNDSSDEIKEIAEDVLN